MFDRCKQTLDFLSKTIIISFIGLRQLNTQSHWVILDFEFRLGIALVLISIFFSPTLPLCAISIYCWKLFGVPFFSFKREKETGARFKREKETWALYNANLCGRFHDIQIEFTLTQMNDSNDRTPSHTKKHNRNGAYFETGFFRIVFIRWCLATLSFSW